MRGKAHVVHVGTIGAALDPSPSGSRSAAESCDPTAIEVDLEDDAIRLFTADQLGVWTENRRAISTTRLGTPRGYIVSSTSLHRGGVL